MDQRVAYFLLSESLWPANGCFNESRHVSAAQAAEPSPPSGPSTGSVRIVTVRFESRLYTLRAPAPPIIANRLPDRQ